MKGNTLLVPVVCALLAVTGCSQGFQRPVREVTATTGTDQVQRVTITTHSFWFDPARVVVRRDVPVELTVRNGSWLVPHDFSCHAADAGIDVDADVGAFLGRSKHLKFTPTRAGEFPFHCGVDHHAKKGMTGVLVVRD